MKVLISGHRKFKLENYNTDLIKLGIEEALEYWSSQGIGVGLSGMASGVDLWFCQICINMGIPYIACPPFEEQDKTMEDSDALLRKELLNKASSVWKIRNSNMVEMCDGGIIVWDGNKGGTHNVFQQMIERNKPFIWLNPVGQKIWNCF